MESKNKKDDSLSAFSNFDITEIQNARNIEKSKKEKLKVVRKLYVKVK